MYELVIRRAGDDERRVKLAGGVFGLGRHESNEIRLDDKEVSRKHARILVDGDVAVIEDLGSGNGTFVGGESVTQAVLSLDTEIEILPFTMVLQKAGALPPGELLGVEGPDEGRTFALTAPRLTIGRGPEQQLRLDDKGASRAHALVVRDGDGWRLHDNQSANGVLVNDAPATDVRLSHGDRITFGHSTLQFVLPGAVSRAAVVAPREDSEERPTQPYVAPPTVPVAARDVRPAPAPAAPTPAPALVRPSERSASSTAVSAAAPRPSSAQVVQRMSAPPPPASGGGNTLLIVAVVGVLGVVMLLGLAVAFMMMRA